MDMQAKLLRAIQNNEITRVGGIRPIKLDIRYIASTNCDLKKKVREGTFRQRSVLPSPRDSHSGTTPAGAGKGMLPGSASILFREFNKQYHKKCGALPGEHRVIGKLLLAGAISVSCATSWNIWSYAAPPTGHVDNSYIYGTFDLSNQNAYVEYDPDQSLNDAITAYEKKYLENALRYARNLKEASQILNIDPSTVSRKLRQHGLNSTGKIKRPAAVLQLCGRTFFLAQPDNRARPYNGTGILAADVAARGPFKSGRPAPVEKGKCKTGQGHHRRNEERAAVGAGSAHHPRGHLWAEHAGQRKPEEEDAIVYRVVSLSELIGRKAGEIPIRPQSRPPPGRWTPQIPPLSPVQRKIGRTARQPRLGIPGRACRCAPACRREYRRSAAPRH